MTVRELIEKLSKFDQELIVTIDGYEGGVTEEISLVVVRVELNVNTGIGYYGEHEEVFSKGRLKKGEVRVLNLSRNQ